MGFAEAQRRLLGPTVFCADSPVDQDDLLIDTANLATELLDRCVNDPDLRRDCLEQARQRLGPHGGGRTMAESITQLLQHS